MARLYRPHVPVNVKCIVAARQAGFPDPVKLVRLCARSHAKLLRALLMDVAKKIGCELSELRLDHDPPLALRPQERRGLGRKTYYTPDANDPDYLRYRPHGAQHDGSHDVKTRVRGEHGQHSDLALIRIAKRRQRKAATKPALEARRPKWKSRPAGKKAKHTWPSRPFQRRK